jgi:hypothetical protein
MILKFTPGLDRPISNVARPSREQASGGEAKKASDAFTGSPPHVPRFPLTLQHTILQLFLFPAMKLLLLALTTLTLAVAPLRAANDAAWRAADDARVAAMISANPAKLKAAFSDDLLYVHSSGKADTKASFTEALTSGKSKYNAITYEQRDFREVVPGLVLVNGRCRVLLGKAAPYTELHLSFLAAYRMEKGKWRFLAWQSCKMPEPTAASK